MTFLKSEESLPYFVLGIIIFKFRNQKSENNREESFKKQTKAGFWGGPEVPVFSF